MQLPVQVAHSSVSVLWRLALAFAKTGLFTFGSGYAMLGQMQKEIVETYGWLTAEQFTDVVAIAEVTPGPITVNMATFVGFRVAGVIGSIVATLGLVIGPICAILIVAKFCEAYRSNPLVDAAFKGLKPVVVALIVLAVLKMGKTSVYDVKTTLFFVAALAGLYFLKLSPIYAALGGIVIGVLAFR